MPTEVESILAHVEAYQGPATKPRGDPLAIDPEFAAMVHAEVARRLACPPTSPALLHALDVVSRAFAATSHLASAVLDPLALPRS